MVIIAVSNKYRTMANQAQPEILLELIKTKMPYGKYKGYLLPHLPEPYLVWYKNKGFPGGKLGMLLNTLYEIKLNGLEFLLNDLQKKA